MKGHATAVAVLLAGVGGLLGLPGQRTIRAQQQPMCAHGPDETDAQKARRRQALGFVRHIGNLEASASATNNGLYKGAEQLQLTQALPSGFQLRLSSSGRSYALSVVDTSDPCKFAYFSDENGLIFRGEVIRSE